MTPPSRGTVRTVLVIVAVLVVVAALVAWIGNRKSRDSAAEPSSSSVLVLTWGPSLCAVSPSNSGCRSGHVGKLGQTFVLHGLWPQPSSEQYCDVPKQMSDRKRSPVPLPEDLKARLQAIMSDSSMLTTHEWYAHGTCSGVAAPEYFAIATSLANEAIRVLNPVFGNSRARPVTVRSVRQAIDGAFGAEAGKRVGLACRDVKGSAVAYEVKLSLPAVTNLGSGGNTLPLAQALSQGPNIGAGCGQARVP